MIVSIKNYQKNSIFRIEKLIFESEFTKKNLRKIIFLISLYFSNIFIETKLEQLYHIDKFQRLIYINMKENLNLKLLNLVIAKSSWLFLPVLLFSMGCQKKLQVEMILPKDKNLTKIAFGSCADQAFENKIFASISNYNPDVWIWLGDIVYASDFKNLDSVKNAYHKQKLHPDYQKLINKSKVIGVWDDHDYAMNDGGKQNPKKDEVKELLFNFLDVPKNSPERKHKGAYQHYDFFLGSKERLVRVILLDVRYFRDDLEKAHDGINRYKPNNEGDILGKEQWIWFEQLIKKSPATLNIIVSGIQVFSDKHGFEKWSNFPKAKERLIKTIRNSEAKGETILLSGDRHIGELSQMPYTSENQFLYEYTSSGMTHVVPKDLAMKEINPYRVGERTFDKNFGVIEIDWKETEKKKCLQLTFKAIGERDKILWEYKVKY
jgi:alkaline phosphatase D